MRRAVKGDIQLAQDKLYPPTMEAERENLRSVFEARKKNINNSGKLPNTDYTNFLGRYQLVPGAKKEEDEE